VLRDFDLFGTRFLALLILLQHFDGFFLFAGKKNLKNSKKNVMCRWRHSRLGARHPFCLDERVGKRGAGVF
jgi:hypothetical protein